MSFDKIFDLTAEVYFNLLQYLEVYSYRLPNITLLTLIATL